MPFSRAHPCPRSCFLIASLALLSASLAATAATPFHLPGAAEIEAAFKRAVAREPSQDDVLVRAMVESIRISEVAGCAPMGKQLWCIVTISGGFKFDQHRVVALDRQDGQWMLIPGHDGELPPAPPKPLAQKLMHEHAGRIPPDDETAADLRRAAAELEVIDVRDCDLVSQDGSILCELDYRLHPAAPATSAGIPFRLSGERWQLAEYP